MSMPLFFTGTWEHALLTATVQAAVESGDNGYLRESTLQNILYFLQGGVPMRYIFDVSYTGPSCDRITHDLVRLLADEVLKEVSPSPEQPSHYRLGPRAEELILSHSSALARHRSTIVKVVRGLSPLDPEHLGLFFALNSL